MKCDIFRIMLIIAYFSIAVPFYGQSGGMGNSQGRHKTLWVNKEEILQQWFDKWEIITWYIFNV